MQDCVASVRVQLGIYLIHVSTKTSSTASGEIAVIKYAFSISDLLGAVASVLIFDLLVRKSLIFLKVIK